MPSVTCSLRSRFLAMTACLATLIVACAGQAQAQAQAPAEAARGASLYRDGQLAGGAMLQARQPTGVALQGAAAACVNCHRRSGLGSYEGTVLIPPIIGPYLFRDRETNLRDLALPHIPGFAPNLRAYDAKSLALALRTGAAPGGRTLSDLMPRYDLDDAALVDLIAYLRNLSMGPMPGVGAEVLEFATIVTPDADAAERSGMLAVLAQYFKVRNANVTARVQSLGVGEGAEYHAARTWRLHVWELTGAPATWEQQLQRKFGEEPVFAVLSGLGRATWAPVHRFCEHNRVPCLLPNVDLPVASEGDFYPVYYTRGVLLEADLIAARLAARPAGGGARLVQVYRDGDIGAAAAAALTEAARGRHLESVVHAMPRPGTQASGKPRRSTELARAIGGLRPRDVLVLWLRPEDVAALGDRLPDAEVYLSGLMANLEQAPLPVPWRAVTHMTYPADTPDLRRIRMNFPHGWFRSQGIGLSADRVQSDTWLACTIMADVLDQMLDSYIPDFLVERLELMLGPRLSNGFYPRLSLAPGQRFASKGGYIVSFEGASGPRVKAEGDWTVP